MQLFWHRRDLRITDNRGLAAGTADHDEGGLIVPTFVLDPSILKHASPPRVAFMLDTLASLRDEYRERDSDLLLIEGDPTDVLPEIATALGVETVVWNEGYSGLARRRDGAVRDEVDATGLDTEIYTDAVHHHPDEIRTNAGDPYSVYTYYWKKWRDREKDDPAAPPRASELADSDAVAEASSVASTVHTELPTLAELGFDEPEATLPDAGTNAARDRLAEFCDGPIYRYEEDREYPARGGTSRLSADLSFGTIGPRTAWSATVEARESLSDRELPVDEETAASSVETFQSQLAWREFYTQVLYHNPHVVNRNYKRYENAIEWREDEEEFEAWKSGKTGYPIVDAGMRQLRSEAHMHNRVRMIVASFLTKDLLLDWRRGYEWFRQRLVDHDTANDVGGWQWAASTGTDAQPYFRIFNPMTQGERYDPDAEYITEYVPELSEVDPDEIHAWHEFDTERRAELAPSYPDPIVDHSERREQALAMFERARGETD